MAKIHEELVVIKVSRLIKDSDADAAQIISEETTAGLEAVIQEMVGDSVVVEVIKG